MITQMAPQPTFLPSVDGIDPITQKLFCSFCKVLGLWAEAEAFTLSYILSAFLFFFGTWDRMQALALERQAVEPPSYTPGPILSPFIQRYCFMKSLRLVLNWDPPASPSSVLRLRMSHHAHS